MRLRDTTEQAPLRRMTVARGRIGIPEGCTVGASEVAAARTAAVTAAKEAFRLVPSASVHQLTDCFLDIEVDAPDAIVGATATVQGFARESLEAAALLAVCAALVSVRDSWGPAGAAATLRDVGVVQSVAH